MHWLDYFEGVGSTLGLVFVIACAYSAGKQSKPAHDEHAPADA